MLGAAALVNANGNIMTVGLFAVGGGGGLVCPEEDFVLCDRRRELNAEQIQHAASYEETLIPGYSVTLRSFILHHTSTHSFPWWIRCTDKKFIRCRY